MNKSSENSALIEAERIDALRKFDILDTPPDGSFDKFTHLAAKLLDMPISIITLVDTDRIWFKSRYGIDAQQIDKDPGLCSSAILSEDIYIVEDAKNDVRTMANPLVAREMGFQFYAGVPLRTREGYNLGTLCVIDKRPRKLNKEKKELLKNLADLVMNQMELRLEARVAVKHQHQILNTTAHDLKNPLSIMPLLAEMILQNKNNPAAIEDMAKQIKSAGKRMTKTLDDILKTAREETGKVQLRLNAIDLSLVLKGVVSTNNTLAQNKNIELCVDSVKSCLVFADQTRLSEILDNIINNAIKYSPADRKIYIKLFTRAGNAIFEVKDEGQGLTKDDLKNLFRPFTSLSAKPTGGENSSGFGLAITKQLVDAHRGKIYASSEGKDKGATFTVELPLSEN